MSTSGREGIGEISTRTTAVVPITTRSIAIYNRGYHCFDHNNVISISEQHRSLPHCCVKHAVKTDRSYEYLQYLTWQNLVKNAWWSVPSPHFPIWRHDIIVYSNPTQRPARRQHSHGYHRVHGCQLSSPFPTSYVVRELQTKACKELDQHCRSHRNKHQNREVAILWFVAFINGYWGHFSCAAFIRVSIYEANKGIWGCTPRAAPGHNNGEMTGYHHS